MKKMGIVGSFLVVFANLLTDVELNLLGKIHKIPRIVRVSLRSLGKFQRGMEATIESPRVSERKWTIGRVTNCSPLR